MLVAALRRFATLLATITAATAVVSLPLGLLAGASVDRSLSLGFYLVGCVLLIAGFFVGNRGPFRAAGEGGSVFFGPRSLRRATPDEREEAVNSSAIYLTIGFLLVVLGVAVDSRLGLI